MGANETLEKAREQEATETQLKILENGQDKLVKIAKAMQLESEVKTGDELR
jgi:ABC-type branched-subunit amino acid transport system ATPase component